MPIYVYQCGQCEAVSEELKRVADRDHLAPRVPCGDGSMMKRKEMQVQMRPHVQSGTSNTRYGS